MPDIKIFYYFLYCILFFIICGVVIIRFGRLISRLFFTDDYSSEYFNEIEPIFKLKNKKMAWVLSFFVPIPIIFGLGSLRLYGIEGFTWYLSLYTKPKTLFSLLGFTYFLEALIFLVIILEQKLVRKTYKNKLTLMLATLFYAILIISFFIIWLKYMPVF